VPSIKISIFPQLPIADASKGTQGIEIIQKAFGIYLDHEYF